MHFGYAKYQGPVEFDGPVDADLQKRLELDPFPNSTPMDFTEQEYSGFKLVPVRDYICLSYFLYDGATDRSDRPVLSARFALLSKDEFESQYRDVGLLTDFLEAGMEDFSKRGLETYLEGRASITQRETFVDVASEFDTQFLARSLSTLLSTSKTTIFYADESRAQRFLRVIFSLLPTAYFTSNAITTRCASTQSNVEDVTLLPATRRSDSQGVGNGVFDKFRSSSDDGDIHLDVDNAPAGDYTTAATSIVATLLDDEQWYDIPWADQRQICTRYLGETYSGHDVTLFDVSEELRQMRQTVERVESFGDAGTFNKPDWL